MTTNVLSGARDHGADDHGPGLWDRLYDDGSRVLTNLRVAGSGRKPGQGMINTATGLLFALGVGLFTVSIHAQYTYIFTMRHQNAVSWLEAIALDAGMAIFSLLALGLARAGQSATIERFLIAVCAIGSAGMNYAAANVHSPRSVAAYVMPPLLLAIVVDRVVAVIKRHVLGDDNRNAWSALGKFGLYIGRLLIAPISTVAGARRALLSAAPVPGSEPKVTDALAKVTRSPKNHGAILDRPVPYYVLRMMVSPFGTVAGVRRAIKRGVAVPDKHEAPAAQPVEAHQILIKQVGLVEPVPAITSAPKRTPTSRTRKTTSSRSRTSGPSKTSQFLADCEAKHGPLGTISLADVYAISKAIAPQHELHEGSARTALRKAIIAGQVGAE